MFDEIERDAIKAEAQTLLKRFSERLANVNLKEIEVKGNDSGMRRVGRGASCDDGFRETMFANSPKKEGDFIIAERKKW